MKQNEQNHKKYIEDIFNEHLEVAKNSFSMVDQLYAVATTIVSSLENGGKVIIFGNGGSAGDAQHIAAEFVNRFEMERPPLPAIALTTDSSAITAISNDYEYNDIFLKQLQALGNKNDVVIGISTSGNSENVVRALTYATKEGWTTVGFVNATGGKMAGLCNHILKAPSTHTARVQEMHITYGHIICGLVDNIMFG